MQPEPAEVTACRYIESDTSPAANTPYTLVDVIPPELPPFTFRYPALSISK